MNQIAQQKLSLRSEAASIPLAAAYYYLLYQLFTVRIARDLLLISSTLNTLNSKLSKIQLAEQKKIADLTVTINPEHLTAKVNKQKAKVYPGVVRLFDSILEGMEKVIDLECVERDGELSAIIDGRINLVKAKR